MTASRINAWGLLTGIVAGFLLAILLGYQAAGYSKPSRFVRFQQWTDPQGIFFPPFRMMEHLALTRWRPRQTVVIVGGNSIFNGVSQPIGEVWSLRLQEILGSDYVVVNLSFSGANPTEAGALVAESLLRQGIPAILVANAGTRAPDRAVGSIYGYYYWEARAQSALLSYPAREADIRQWEAGLPPAEQRKQAELRRAAELNARFYFQELWHHVGNRHLFTVWNFLTHESFWRPRDRWPDPELSPPPVEARFLNYLDAEMQIVRQFSSEDGRQDEQGRWQLNPLIAADFSKRIEAEFVPQLRPRMLIVLCQNAPFYRSKLTPDEQARDLAVFAGCEAAWRQQGIACITSGLGFIDDDYNDRTHLTASGGRKLAALVAEQIRKLDR